MKKDNNDKYDSMCKILLKENERYTNNKITISDHINKIIKFVIAHTAKHIKTKKYKSVSENAFWHLYLHRMKRKGYILTKRNWNIQAWK